MNAAPVDPAAFLAAAARVATRILQGHGVPAQVTFEPTPRRFEEQVDEAAARQAWTGAMAPEGFAAPKLIDLAKLGAWTLKPAFLRTL